VDRVVTNRRAGVRASIVASKPGNAGGAKGRRKMEYGGPFAENFTLPNSAARLPPVEKAPPAWGAPLGNSESQLLAQPIVGLCRSCPIRPTRR
jgi:hypothetical protein